MKSIEVPALARVEGEGGLYIGLQDGKAVEIRLDIYEPPRFFEGFLVDRFLQEVPDITARICGICPVAYQMSAVHALEAACGVRIDGPIRDLRRLVQRGNAKLVGPDGNQIAIPEPVHDLLLMILKNLHKILTGKHPLLPL